MPVSVAVAAKSQRPPGWSSLAASARSPGTSATREGISTGHSARSINSALPDSWNPSVAPVRWRNAAKLARRRVPGAAGTSESRGVSAKPARPSASRARARFQPA